MTPDKEHTPALMQQAADEAVEYEIDLTADEELIILLDETFEDTGVLALKTAALTIQRLVQERDAQYEENVARIAAEGAAILRAEAAEAKVAVAAEDERDRLYDMAMEEASATRNGTKRRERAAWAAEWLRLNGAGSRAVLRTLTQEPSNAE